MVVVVVTYEYCSLVRPSKESERQPKVQGGELNQKRVLTTVLVPELMVEVVVDCFTDRQEQPLLMREGVGYALM